jgi:DNA-binding XRE family transcriptional regulator
MKQRRRNPDIHLISMEEHNALMNWTPEDLAEIEQYKQYYLASQQFTSTRRQLRLTQAEVAARAGLPRSTVAKVESGMRNARLSTLMAMARAMGKTLKIELV